VGNRSQIRAAGVNQRRLAFASIVLVVTVVLGAVAWSVFHPSRRLQSASQSPIVGRAEVGEAAPEFEVSTTAGLFDLAKTTKPVFLEIFATWCPHCQREAAVIDRLYRAYLGRVDFVGVSGSDTAMDGTSESSQLDVLNWAQHFNVQYPVGYDPVLQVANLYLQGGFPTFAIIDKNKKVAYLNSGELPYQELRTAIENVLRTR
jgi:cytochrome c biogenesis protein CcmG, thiol:disulfide interchange protein DsbE